MAPPAPAPQISFPSDEMWQQLAVVQDPMDLHNILMQTNAVVKAINQATSAQPPTPLSESLRILNNGLTLLQSEQDHGAVRRVQSLAGSASSRIDAEIGNRLQTSWTEFNSAMSQFQVSIAAELGGALRSNDPQYAREIPLSVKEYADAFSQCGRIPNTEITEALIEDLETIADHPLADSSLKGTAQTMADRVKEYNLSESKPTGTLYGKAFDLMELSNSLETIGAQTGYFRHEKIVKAYGELKRLGIISNNGTYAAIDANHQTVEEVVATLGATLKHKYQTDASLSPHGQATFSAAVDSVISGHAAIIAANELKKDAKLDNITANQQLTGLLGELTQFADLIEKGPRYQVRRDSSGQELRDPQGNPVYELDADGEKILIDNRDGRFRQRPGFKEWDAVLKLLCPDKAIPEDPKQFDKDIDQAVLSRINSIIGAKENGFAGVIPEDQWDKVLKVANEIRRVAEANMNHQADSFDQRLTPAEQRDLNQRKQGVLAELEQASKELARQKIIKRIIFWTATAVVVGVCVTYAPAVFVGLGPIFGVGAVSAGTSYAFLHLLMGMGLLALYEHTNQNLVIKKNYELLNRNLTRLRQRADVLKTVRNMQDPVEREIAFFAMRATFDQFQRDFIRPLSPNLIDRLAELRGKYREAAAIENGDRQGLISRDEAAVSDFEQHLKVMSGEVEAKTGSSQSYIREANELLNDPREMIWGYNRAKFERYAPIKWVMGLWPGLGVTDTEVGSELKNGLVKVMHEVELMNSYYDAQAKYPVGTTTMESIGMKAAENIEKFVTAVAEVKEGVRRPVIYGLLYRMFPDIAFAKFINPFDFNPNRK